MSLKQSDIRRLLSNGLDEAALASLDRNTPITVEGQRKCMIAMRDIFCSQSDLPGKDGDNASFNRFAIDEYLNNK